MINSDDNIHEALEKVAGLKDFFRSLKAMGKPKYVTKPSFNSSPYAEALEKNRIALGSAQTIGNRKEAVRLSQEGNRLMQRQIEWLRKK